MSRSDCSHALVTGGAGFIGSHLVRALVADGLSVTVLDNLSTGVRSVVDPAARFVRGDVRSESDVRRALDGVDCIFHLSAKVSVRASFEHFYEDIDTNLLGTCNLVRCLSPGAVRRFVLASSMAVYAESGPADFVAEDHQRGPISPYGIGKMSAELVCRQVLDTVGIPFTALRFFNTYGPGQRFTPYVGVITIFVTRLLGGQCPVVFGDGGQRRDFVHVSDIVAGNLAALTGPPGTYNLGTGRATTVKELAELLVGRIDPSVEVIHGPEQPGELRNSVADIRAARTRLGYEPGSNLGRDIDGVIDYIRNSGEIGAAV